MTKFHHGGRLGDLVFALYTIKEFCDNNKTQAELHLSDYHTPGWGLEEINIAIDMVRGLPYISRVTESSIRSFIGHREGYPSKQDVAKYLLFKEFENEDYDLVTLGEGKINPKDFHYWNGHDWPGNVKIIDRYYHAVFGRLTSKVKPWFPVNETKGTSLIMHWKKSRSTKEYPDKIDILKRIAKDVPCLLFIDRQEYNHIVMNGILAPVLRTGVELLVDETVHTIVSAIRDAGAMFYGDVSFINALCQAHGLPCLCDIAPGCDNTLHTKDTTKCPPGEVADYILSLLRK